MKVNNLNRIVLSYSGATVEHLAKIYEKYNIACVCNSDDNGFYTEIDRTSGINK